MRKRLGCCRLLPGPPFLRGLLWLALVLLPACGSCKPASSNVAAPQESRPSSPYAGSSVCQSCHPSVYAAWRSSHHALGQELGGGALTRSLGKSTVTLDTAQGPRELSIQGVIGVEPLILPLVTLDGRLQISTQAFEPAKKAWFDVFAGEGRHSGEWGHWSGRGMTWNLQCAYCHTTRFVKGYDLTTTLYCSQFVETGVGCEACHGPKAEHARTARADTRELSSPPPGPIVPGSAGLPRSSEPFTCAPCHSRRSQVAEGHAPLGAGAAASEAEARFLDHFDPALPDDPAWHEDGQVKEEVYEWVSFAQSRMSAKGVRCSHCHEPHSGKTRLAGNALCLQCHPPRLATREHTFHAPGQGDGCVDCHMPTTVFMQKDSRRDHSFSRPIPEATRALGLPNACNGCHLEKDAAWASRNLRRWFPGRVAPSLERARLFHRARKGELEDSAPLRAMLADPALPEVVRAAAATLLQPFHADSAARQALAQAQASSSALIRLRATRTLAEGGAPELITTGKDPVRSVRIAAAWGTRRPGLALDEARAAAVLNADHPAGRLELASLAKDDAELELHLRAALDLDPAAAPARMALAEHWVRSGRFEPAAQLLVEGLKVSPEEPAIPGLLGQIRVQQRRIPEARAAFRRLLDLEPTNADVRRELEALGP
jgi:hypothetical protein